jgi:hypothetical protein
MLRIKEFLRKISIRGRLILFMTVIVIVISYFNLYFYNKAYNSIDEYNRLLKEYSEVNNLSIQLIEGRDSISKYASADSDSAGDKSDLMRYNASNTQTNLLAHKIFTSSNSLDTYLLSMAIKNSLETYEDEVQKIFPMKPSSEGIYLQYLKVKNVSLY